MKKKMKKQLIHYLLLSMFVFAVLLPVSVQAASFTRSKPVIAGDSAYLNGKVYLRWSKVKGAKKYEIQRALVSASTGKTGAWKKWKTVKKTSVTASASGDYKYRIRALKGSSSGKWSVARRIFAANAQITNMGYTEPETLFGVTLRSGQLEFRVLVTNRTKSPMGFVDSGTRFGVQHTVSAVDKSSGAVIKQWDGYLDTTGIAKQVNAGKSESIYLYAFVDDTEWAQCKDCKFLIASSFYPNPEVEPISTQMAIAYTDNPADSSVAAK